MWRNTKFVLLATGIVATAIITSASAQKRCDQPILNANGWKWTKNAKPSDMAGCLRGHPDANNACDSQSYCAADRETEWMPVTRGSMDDVCESGYYSYCFVGRSSAWLDHYWIGAAPLCGNRDCLPGYVKIARDPYGDLHIKCTRGKRSLCVKYADD